MTKIFTLVMFIIVAIYDVYAIVTGGTENSISHLLIVSSYKYPILPFLIGVVCGHLFWRLSDTRDTKKIADFIHMK